MELSRQEYWCELPFPSLSSLFYQLLKQTSSDHCHFLQGEAGPRISMLRSLPAQPHTPVEPLSPEAGG